MHAREHRNLVRVALEHDWRRVHLHRPALPQKVCKRKRLGALPVAPCALALGSPVSMSQGLQAPGSGSLDLQCACRVQIPKLNLHPTSIQSRVGGHGARRAGRSQGRSLSVRLWAGAHQEVRVCCGSCCAVDLSHVQRRHLHRQHAQGPQCSSGQCTLLVRPNTYAVCHMQRTLTNSQGSRQSITWRAPLQSLQADTVILQTRLSCKHHSNMLGMHRNLRTTSNTPSTPGHQHPCWSPARAPLQCLTHTQQHSGPASRTTDSQHVPGSQT